MVTQRLDKSNIGIEIREFVNLAVPLASAQVAQAAVGFVDTLMMGHLGAASLAAGGIASTTFQFLLATASGVVMAVSPLIAEANGAGQKGKIEQITRHGLWVTLLVSLPMMALVGHLDAIMLQLGQNQDTVELANPYLDWMLWGLFPALGFAMLRGYVSALSQAHLVTVIVVLGTLINVVGNYLLGFGKFGFPRMELAGLGLASGLSFWVMFLALLFCTLKHQRLKEYRFLQDWYHVQWYMLQKIAMIGIPIALTIALEYGLFTIVTYLMGILGTETLAAHQTVYQTIYLLFMVPLGMSFAVTVRVGQWFGQRNFEKARWAGYVGISATALYMLITSIVMILSRRTIVDIYIDVRDPVNSGITELATAMIIVAAFSQLLDGVQRVAMGALQGLQDMRMPVLLGVLAYWGVGLSSGYLLGFVWGFGGIGLWIGQSIGVAVAGFILVWRFYHLTSK